MAKIVENALVIYTDGSLYPAGRTGGYGALFLYFDDVGNEIEIDNYQPPSLKGTTNNRMELEACIAALKRAPGFDCYEQVHSVVIRTDSTYVTANYWSALTRWRINKWRTRDGRPVANTGLWKDFVREYAKIRKPVVFEKVKGHGKGLQKDPHNVAADKLAKASAKSPLTRKEYRSSVRRKKSPKRTDVGSIEPRGQQIRLHVIETQRLPEHRTWKYRCEVVSTDSSFYQNVDWLYSDKQLRDGHVYEVLLNDDAKYPQIVEVICEPESPDEQ